MFIVRGALCSEFTVIGILVSAMDDFFDVLRLIERRVIHTVDAVLTHALFLNTLILLKYNFNLTRSES